MENKNTELIKEKKELELKIAEFNRNYSTSIELLERSSDEKELLERILDEYILRLDEFDGIDLTNIDHSQVTDDKKEKFKSLVMFATQASILNEKAKFYQQAGSFFTGLQKYTYADDQDKKKLEDTLLHALSEQAETLKTGAEQLAEKDK